MKREIHSFHGGEVELAVSEQGAGRPVLVLHGGGGPLSIAGFVEAMAGRGHVLAPTHPGFGATERPPQLDSVRKLAELYAEFLARRDLRDVLLVGFSMGGWVAAELALAVRDRLRGLVLVDAIGVDVPGERVADVFSLSPRQFAELGYADPDAHFVDPATQPPERAATMAANFRALAAYCAMPGMVDPGLAARLRQLRIPAQVVWGENDRIVTPAYGRAFAAMLDHARFELVPGSGHMPQIEQPERLLAVIDAFAAA